MKVLHYIWTADIGGIERLVIDLAEAQRDQGIDAQILTGRKIGDFSEELVYRGIPFDCCGLLSGFDISPIKVRQLIKKMNAFDLVHLHIFHPAIAAATWLAKAKVVYTIHGLSSVDDSSYIRGSTKEFLKKSFLHHGIDYLTVNSKYTRDKALQQYGIKKTAFCIVLNGTRVKVARERNINDDTLLDWLRDKFVVGTTSRFTPRKRLERLIEAFAHFQQSKDALLLMVGDGAERKPLERLVNSFEIPNKVRFTGYTKHASFYQGFIDIGVYPSTAESFGLVALEFFLLGKPIIVFEDGGGLVEIVSGIRKDDVVSTVDGLADRLEFYYQNRKLLEKEKPELIAYAKKFDISLTARNFSKIYQEVLS